MSYSGAHKHPVLIGTLCGVAAAFCWGAGFVAAKHGVSVGMAPADLALHRFVWTGFVLTLFMARTGLADLGGIGWGRGIVLMLLGGPVQAFMAYKGYTLVPLGHGAVIQPGCAALFGPLLAAAILHEHLSGRRIFGAVVIVLGLVTFGIESITAIGSHGLGGDFLFVGAGMFWAGFGIALRRWSVSGMRAAMIVGALAFLIYTPLHGILFGYQHMIDVGLRENVLQAFAQGGLAGALPIYLFARAVMLLGAGRASTFPALVPIFTIALGFLLIGEVPTILQLAGLAVVLIGFRFALKA